MTSKSNETGNAKLSKETKKGLESPEGVISGGSVCSSCGATFPDDDEREEHNVLVHRPS